MVERVNESEYRFLTILWENEPIGSPDLVKKCLDRLGWKKSTTYTVMKRLEGKQIVENCAAVVRSLVSKEQVDAQESAALLEKNFNGNIPTCLAAFLRGRKLNKEEAARIRKMLEEQEEQEDGV